MIAPPEVDARRGAIVARAWSLIGTPYGHRGTGAKLDCLSFFREAWAAAGIVVPEADYPEGFPNACPGSDRLELGIIDLCGAVRPGAGLAFPGDVLLFAPARRTVGHVGILVGDHVDGRTGHDWFLHVWESAGAVCANRLTERFWARSLRGFGSIPRAKR